ncbi:hypothetical protein ABBQ32_007895 [Trebouxia sp. C0010 RCD-2024]
MAHTLSAPSSEAALQASSQSLSEPFQAALDDPEQAPAQAEQNYSKQCQGWHGQDHGELCQLPLLLTSIGCLMRNPSLLLQTPLSSSQSQALSEHLSVETSISQRVSSTCLAALTDSDDNC